MPVRTEDAVTLYRFEPEEDITAYEVALLVMGIPPFHLSGIIVTDDQMRGDEGNDFPVPPKLHRHFKPIGGKAEPQEGA